MSEIAQLFESALRNNRATLLRQAAIRTIERMPADTTIRELMGSEAAAALRELTHRIGAMLTGLIKRHQAQLE